MVLVTLQVDTDDIIGVKETLAMYMERFDDVCILDVWEVGPDQMRLEGVE